MRLLVIKGPRYHLTQTKTDRREPAFLICTDPTLPLDKVLQYYSWRWDTEVNFRDEKTILGVGQAQVRNPASNQNAPALAVAAYAIRRLRLDAQAAVIVRPSCGIKCDVGVWAAWKTGGRM